MRFRYLDYTQSEPYLFIRVFARDRDIGSSVANGLCEHGVRLFFDICGDRESHKPDVAAERISSCAGAVFFLSKAACDSLDFRNSINYALSLRKRVVCVMLEEFTLSHGLEMQLANIERISAFEPKALEQLVDRLLRCGAVNQEMMGETPQQRNLNRGKKILFAGIITLSVLIFVTVASVLIKNRVEYYNSPEWLLRDADGAKYLDLAPYGQDGLEALEGMSIDTLSLADMQLPDIDAIDVSIRTVDLSGNDGIRTLEPLTRCAGLETVRISQDMLIYSKALLDAGITVEITR